ncbi:MAG: hypothetical protein LBT92_02940 [Rickettsiales bacterium]|jgi:hypothetical protein|nr:hypothetical protein [Rickettsiales bacterium]
MMKKTLFAVFALGLVFAVGVEAAKRKGGGKKGELDPETSCEVVFADHDDKITECNEKCPGLLGKELGKCIKENKIKTKRK